MKRSVILLLAVVFTVVASAQAPAKLHLIDAQTPQGLRELFRASADRLPLVSAHRGGAGPGWPENCLATFEATLRHGWALLEVDLRTSKDGAIVLMHDATLDRTTNGSGPVKERTLAELRQLRLKDRQGNLTDHRIPTLDEVMQWARGKTILMLDKKEVPVKEVVAIIARHRAESYAMMLAYSLAEVLECHALNPDIMMEAMLGTRARYDEFAAAGGPWGNIIAFVGHTATPDVELCRLIRAKGARCMAGTSRNLDLEFLRGHVATLEPLQAGYRAVLERGVDVIETDIPRELSPWLHARPPPAGSDKARYFKLGQP